MIHLDTGFLIRALVPGSAEDRRLRAWLREGTTLGISVIGWAEFLCGPVDAAQAELALRLIGEPVPFSAADATRAALLFNASGRRRGTFVDCLIAASALGAGAKLATSNPDDFRRFQELEIVVA